MNIRSVSLISFILILSASQGLAVTQYHTLDQFSYDLELDQNYAWKVVGEGRDVNEQISFRAEINILITQLNPELDYSIGMALLSGNFPLQIPIDGIYGGWMWDNQIWDFPNTPATFGRLIYPTDNSYWNSRYDDIVDGNYIIHRKKEVAIFVQGLIHFTGSATDRYYVDSDTGLLQIYEHNAQLSSNINDESFELYFSLEYQGKKVNDEENNFIDIMNFTLTSNKIDLFTNISWGIITISLIGVIILNVRYFVSRNKNQ